MRDNNEPWIHPRRLRGRTANRLSGIRSAGLLGIRTSCPSKPLSAICKSNWSPSQLRSFTTIFHGAGDDGHWPEDMAFAFEQIQIENKPGKTMGLIRGVAGGRLGEDERMQDLAQPKAAHGLLCQLNTKHRF
jgi:hypothetical protein